MPKVDLSQLEPDDFPNSEDDTFEFKSSQASDSEIKKKLDRAVSGFSNAGGGCFIYGVDDEGNADGGVNQKVGRQDLRDWLDQVITKIAPLPEYNIRLYEDCGNRGTLEHGKVIAAISISPSNIGPHQATDKKYYIRAGAHTEPASHYLVEAIWARRHMQKPKLAHAIRRKPDDTSVIQIGVIAVTDAPALDVEVTIDPLPSFLIESSDYFPIRLPILDRATPFYMDATSSYQAVEDLQETKVIISYKDSAGNEYAHESDGSLVRSLSPVVVGYNVWERVVTALEEIERKLK